MFSVGDRVKRITSSGGHAHIPCDTILVVRRGQMAGMIYVEGYEGGLLPSRFVLVEAAAIPVDNREEITIYTLIYTHPAIEGKIVGSFLNENTAIQQADLIRRESNNYTLLAMKKFKTRI